MTHHAGWTRDKPTEPGIYQVRGFNVCQPRSKQFVATVVVVYSKLSLSETLLCNLHVSTSEDDLREWTMISKLSDAFEWRGPFVRL